MAALLVYLRNHWQTKDLVALLGCGEPDTVKTALVCLSLVGALADSPAVVRALHACDKMVAKFAEHCLWSIWLRDGEPEANAQLQQAVQLIAEERLDEALDVLDNLLECAPGLAEAYNQRAIVLFLAGEYEAAADDCRQTLKHNPHHFAAMAGLGHCHAAEGRFREAYDAYRSALEIHPRLEGLHRSMQTIRECLRRHASAESPPSFLPDDSSIPSFHRYNHD